MSKSFTHQLSQLLTIAGLCLMLAGGTLWWRQSRLEAALLSHPDRILLAVTAETEPARLPEFREAADPLARATVTAPPVVERNNILRGSSPIAPTQTFTPTQALTPTQTVTSPPDPFPAATEIPSRITIPAIDLNTSVVEMGWETYKDEDGNVYSEWLVPAYAAGWHKNSALPGHESNVVLSGHHNVDGEVFRYLVDLELGDEVILEAGGWSYRYRIEEKYIVKEKDEPLEVRLENNRFIEPTTSEQLTLVTCWPYETNTHRVIIVARPLVEGNEIIPTPGIE